MTYAELVAKIQVWWESDETAFLAEIDTFIEHGELRIYRSVDLDTAKKGNASAGVITQGIDVITLPPDVVTIRYVHLVDSGGFVLFPILEQKDLSFLRDYAPDNSVEGVPKYYAWFDDDTLILAPTPDATTATGTFNVQYTYRPTQLSGSQTTTWLSLNVPDLLFYSCMLDALTFEKAEADTIADYTAKYQQALQAVLLEENMRNRTDSYRAGEIRMGL
jgi:hypothetical protein